MDDASKRIIAKIMRALTKLPIGISHAPSRLLPALFILIWPIRICPVKPKLF